MMLALAVAVVEGCSGLIPSTLLLFIRQDVRPSPSRLGGRQRRLSGVIITAAAAAASLRHIPAASLTLMIVHHIYTSRHKRHID